MLCTMEGSANTTMFPANAFVNETTDFSNLTKVAFNVYNAQSESQSVRFELNPHGRPHICQQESAGLLGRCSGKGLYLCALVLPLV